MRFIVQADKSVALPRSPMRRYSPAPSICPLGKGCDALRDRFAAEDQAAPDIADMHRDASTRPSFRLLNR